MELDALGQDRFLRKDASQNSQTKGPVYTAANPSPKRGDDAFRKVGRPKGSEEDDGAPNILTGTVIVSCFIQTSALPSRIELEGNDLTFFDDTYEQNGTVIGDTSRLIFTHGSGKNGETITQGFIMEKRASIYNTYDNVLSWYALPAKQGAHNYMFIGREGRNGENRNLSTLRLAVNEDSSTPTTPINQGTLNGVFAIEYSIDGVEDPANVMFYAGASRSITQGLIPNGFSTLMIAGDGGLCGIGYKAAAAPHSPLAMLYILSEAAIQLGATMLPDADNAYDIGSASVRLRKLYSTTIAIGAGRTWSTGAGSPEGVVTAPIGSLYSNTSGGASTTLYVKTSGSGNTGWTAK